MKMLRITTMKIMMMIVMRRRRRRKRWSRKSKGKELEQDANQVQEKEQE